MITLPKIVTVFDTETTGTGGNAPVVSYGSVRVDLKKTRLLVKLNESVIIQIDA